MPTVLHQFALIKLATPTSTHWGISCELRNTIGMGGISISEENSLVLSLLRANAPNQYHQT